MFKGHPKGLYVAFFANMGERFGFYTMMAILVLFLQAKFGLDADKAGSIYSIFYFSIYALALVGGIIADRTQNYKGTIMVGIFVMFAGYLLMATPGMGLTFTVVGLFTIAIGNGLFKGNLQALVGQMYDDPKYSKLRDSAFSVFYMGINVGAFFAPSAARAMRSWYLHSNGFAYDSDLPALCHKLLSGKQLDVAKLQELADKVTLSGGHVTDLKVFALDYINVFSTGYNYAFGVAALAMVISLLSYVLFKKHLPDRKALAVNNPSLIKMPWAEEKKRLIALLLVFVVVIFFWMSFHQNGLSLTMFARDYMTKTVDPVTNIMFYLPALLSLIAAIAGIVMLVQKKASSMNRAIGAGLTIVGAYLVYYFFKGMPAANPIEPEIFQQFNPLFIVALTPLVVWFFAWLRNRNIEPSTPKKIGIGMILAALGFSVMIASSIGLVSQVHLAGEPSPERISAHWLITTYLVLTFAELFLSPMGISFVSKVSPPRFQGLMQGGWLGAAAVGNLLLWIGSSMYIRLELWQVWLIFVVCCLVSAAFIFSIMKRLEDVAK
jgi:POT family proton-dependent oligopeptide transporter